MKFDIITNYEINWLYLGYNLSKPDLKLKAWGFLMGIIPLNNLIW